PEDTVPTADGGDSSSQASDFSSDIVNFTMFMRMLAPPTPALPFTTSSTASTTPASTATSTSSSSCTSSTSTMMASLMPMAAVAPWARVSRPSPLPTSSPAPPARTQEGSQESNNMGFPASQIVTQTPANLPTMTTTTTAGVRNPTNKTFSVYPVQNMGRGLAD